ncbi:MAG: hypothetical protein HN337_07620 [Deltaproteobacteria bacterium]|jgi:hypothetical protein|nr:hypothetical protein [Deltaproteobacteria bacterium]
MAREVSGNRAVLAGRLKPLDTSSLFGKAKTKKPFDIIKESQKDPAEASRKLAATTGSLNHPKSILERTT